MKYVYIINGHTHDNKNEPISYSKMGIIPQQPEDENKVVENLALMLQCDSVYVLRPNKLSKVAEIELKTAQWAKKDIIYSSPFTETDIDPIETIKFAINRATGIEFESWRAKSRKRQLHYNRIIFIHLASSYISVEQMKAHIGRSTTTIARHLSAFEDEIRWNKKFKALFERVEFFLNSNVSL